MQPRTSFIYSWSIPLASILPQAPARDMRSHPKKGHLLMPDAVLRGTPYICCNAAVSVLSLAASISAVLNNGL